MPPLSNHIRLILCGVWVLASSAWAVPDPNLNDPDAAAAFFSTNAPNFETGTINEDFEASTLSLGIKFDPAVMAAIRHPVVDPALHLPSTAPLPSDTSPSTPKRNLVIIASLVVVLALAIPAVRRLKTSSRS